MAQPKLIASLGLIGALALSAAPSLAAGKGPGPHLRAVPPALSNTHGRPAAKPAKPAKGTAPHGKSLRQLEGVVVSFDGSALVMQPMGHHALTVTVTISSSTIITAEEGVTPTLTAGEQIHVAAVAAAGG